VLVEPTATPGTQAAETIGKVRIELKPLRAAGAVMLAGAVVRPHLPAHLGPPCPLRTLTGVPCPFCGMTRGVTAFVHGDLGASLMFNPGAVLLVALAVVLLVAWRWRRVTIPMWVLVVFFATLWAFQLFKYATGRPL
jgi:uncharacterized protein DUF2752